MKTLKYICLLAIGFVFIMGCSGNNANIKNLPESESKGESDRLDLPFFIGFNLTCGFLKR